MTEHPFLVKTPEPRYFAADHCANCLTPLTEDIIGLWCSSWCNDVNAKVRYWRKVERDGRIEDPMIRDQLRVNLAFLLIGGYKALGRRPSPAVRKQVIKRDNGRCQSCGKPATDLDHINGNSDDPSNLQMLCKSCHRDKTFAALTAAGEVDMESRALLIALAVSRVNPDQPRLLADDETQWEDIWSDLKAERKARFMDSLHSIGFVHPRAAKLSRLQLLAARDAYVEQLREDDEQRERLREAAGKSGDWWFEDLMRR